MKFSGGETNIFLEKLFQSRNEKQESYKSSDCSLTERDENDLVFGIMTTVGYWFITMVLLIGLVLGDRPKITVIGHFVKRTDVEIQSSLQIFLFNIFGFLFFLSLGSEQIARYKGASEVRSYIIIFHSKIIFFVFNLPK